MKQEKLSEENVKNPLSDDLEYHLKSEAKQIRQRYDRLQTEAYEIYMRLKSLRRLAEQYDFEADELEFYCLAPHKEMIDDLMTFKLMFSKTDKPFFCSEMYDILGKTDAQSIRSLILRVCKALDPVQGIEFHEWG